MLIETETLLSSKFLRKSPGPNLVRVDRRGAADPMVPEYGEDGWHQRF